MGAGSPVAVGVDLGRTQIRAAVVRDGEILAFVSGPTGRDDGLEAVLGRMKDAVRGVLSKAGMTTEDIAGIGIGCPGPMNSKLGIVYNPPNFKGWNNVPLRQIFQDEFKVPVAIGHDVKVAVLGEYTYGAGKGAEYLIYVTISSGIGAGLMFEGRILEGATGTAGEIGHASIDAFGTPCGCGSYGCFEVLSSGIALGRQATELVEKGQAESLRQYAESVGQSLPYEGKFVGKAAEAGDPVAKELIDRAATYMGVSIANLVNSFNPNIIVIGGGVTNLGEPLFNKIREVAEKRAFVNPYKAVKIVPAALGDAVGLIGAAAFVYYTYPELKPGTVCSV